MPPRGSGTAWTADLIRPPTHKPSAQTPPKSNKGKGRANTPEPPRSAAVRKLDELLAGLRSSEPTKPQRQNNTQDGCFCQARTHAPSEYTPLCTTCGLILCTLHAPHRPCPSCSTGLLDPSARTALLVQLEERRAHTLAEEAAARARAAEELRLAEGAFPALGPAPAPPGGVGAGKGGVLSFDAQTKRVRVEAYRATSVSARESADADAEEDAEAETRVPPPASLREVLQFIRVPRGPATRWAVSKDGQGGAKYVAAPEHGRGKARA